MKILKQGIDGTFGAMMRWLFRNLLVHPLIWWNYAVTLRGADDALSCTNGAILVSNHISRLDGPFIMSIGWPYARVRPTAWHAEYSHWLQWPLMKLFGTVPLGSPKHLPEEERQRRKLWAIETMRKILRAGRHLLIFAEGSISDGSRATIKPHLAGVHDLIAAYPEMPVLLIRLDGLQYSAFGKLPKRLGLFRRLPVSATLTRVDNVSLAGGPAGLNARLEAYFNEGVSLATTCSQGKMFIAS